jgi:hypothetical protein
MRRRFVCYRRSCSFHGRNEKMTGPSNNMENPIPKTVKVTIPIVYNYIYFLEFTTADFKNF